MMDPEVEKAVGLAERAFNISKDRLAKSMAVLEWADERGENVARLAADLADAERDLAEVIIRLNACYVQRNPAAPLVVKPVEYFLEFFREQSEAKRADLNAAREEEAQALATAAYTAALRANTRPVAPVAPVALQRFKPEPPARPATCSLQDVIDELEVRLNKAICEFDYLDLKVRSQKLARMVENISARAKANIDLNLADLDPPYEKKKKEVAELRALHKQLMAQRGDGKKAAGKS